MEFVGLDNYVRMLAADDIFWRSSSTPSVYLAICLVLQLGGALLVASLLTSLRRGRELIKTLYLLPAVISTVAIAFLFVRIYSIDPVGLLNQLLHWIGLGSLERPWLSDVNTVLAAVSRSRGLALHRAVHAHHLRRADRRAQELEEAAAWTAPRSGPCSPKSASPTSGPSGSPPRSWRPRTACAASTSLTS